MTLQLPPFTLLRSTTRESPDARAAPSTRACIGVVLLHGIGTGTADELTRVNNHRPSIFLASPSRSTWLLAVAATTLLVWKKGVRFDAEHLKQQAA